MMYRREKKFLPRLQLLQNASLNNGISEIFISSRPPHCSGRGEKREKKLLRKWKKKYRETPKTEPAQATHISPWNRMVFASLGCWPDDFFARSYSWIKLNKYSKSASNRIMQFAFGRSSWRDVCARWHNFSALWPTAPCWQNSIE